MIWLIVMRGDRLMETMMLAGRTVSKRLLFGSTTLPRKTSGRLSHSW
jgi:hypothetical protein